MFTPGTAFWITRSDNPGGSGLDLDNEWPNSARTLDAPAVGRGEGLQRPLPDDALKIVMRGATRKIRRRRERWNIEENSTT
jgi:hypothetical protein